MDELVSGAIVFTGERSRQGYRLNRMAMSLTSSENRARFRSDEDGFLREWGLHVDEVELVRRRDWKGMLEHGASIYLVIKIAGALGHSLPQVGAHTAGITLEEFHARKGH
jgi:protocatechuate 4,5-dioxygenase alpha chain